MGNLTLNIRILLRELHKGGVQSFKFFLIGVAEGEGLRGGFYQMKDIENVKGLNYPLPGDETVFFIFRLGERREGKGE